jgi:exonuclease SbcC
MKPIKLAISAFGPYANVQTIDFRELGSKRFFLIHGPTGGGKTTILDAMCYALYGETSGKERDGEQMRSQMARADVPTVVSFDFAIGEKQFRVIRKPRQERPRKKGEGTTTDNPIAELWDRTGVNEDAEGAPLATQPGKVTEKVISLLGFRSEQFRQVIVLPQGKFRELLLANSEQREDILQTIFRTSFFEQVQDALKAKAKVLAEKIKAVADGRALVLRHAGVESLDQLKARDVGTRLAHTLAEANLKLLRESVAAAQSKYSGDQQTSASFVEHRSAAAALKAIEKMQAAVEKALAEVDAAERAKKVAVEESTLHQRKKDRDDRKRAHNDAAENEKEALIALDSAKAKVTAEEARKEERDGRLAEAARLNGLRGRVANLETAISNAAKAKAQSLDLAQRHKVSKQSYAKAKAAAEAAKSALTAARSLAAWSEAHRLAVSNTQRAVMERKALGIADETIAAKTKELAAAGRELSRARLALQAAKASLADVQRAWITGQSARLARELVDGEPCPVCGARDHPQLATSKVDVPSDEGLKSKQDAVDMRSVVVERAGAAAKELESRIAAEAATAKTYRLSLGNAANEDVSALRRRLDEQRAAFQRSNDASASIGTHEQLVNGAVGAETAEQLFENGLAAKSQLAVVAASTADATLMECRNGVPEKLGTVALLDAEVSRFRGLADGIDAAIKRASDSFNTAQQAATAATELSKSAYAEVADSEEKFHTARDEFVRKRAEYGFASDPELTAAKRADAQLGGLRERIETHMKALSAAMDRAERASVAVAGLQEPDLEASTTLAETARKQLEGGITLSGNLKRDLELIKRALADVEEASEELNTLETQYAVIGRIAEVADGKNNAGLKFSRFVLGSLLDDVLIAATERLKIMSQGRYHLQRRMERADLRGHGGLDLEVFDAHTGFSRPAATLSGGESFLASLSLALGLADAVQAQAGGIRMETMFIDEGFASLDSETLDLSIRSLIDLFSDGRLVGIISHVSELQELIDARLEITSSQRGSAAKFVLS